MNHHHTIEDIEKITSLPKKYIRDCIVGLKDYLDEQRCLIKGNKNVWLFDDNGLKIFDVIKQLKDNRYSIQAIKEYLENSKVTHSNHESKAQLNESETNNINVFLVKIEQLTNQVIQAKNETIEKQEELLEKEKLVQLQGYQLKLLTDGRTPEEVREEQKKKEDNLRLQNEELLQTKYELSAKDNQLSLLNQRIEEQKRKEEELKHEVLTIKESQSTYLTQKEKEAQLIKDQRIREKELIEELKSLEGKLFKGKRRKEILAELEQLTVLTV